MRAKDGTGGRCCESGWTDVDDQSGPAAILELAPRTHGAPLDAAAPVGPSQPAPLHHDRDLPHPTVRDPAVQAAAPIGTHPTLEAMPDLRVLLHGTNL